MTLLNAYYLFIKGDVTVLLARIAEVLLVEPAAKNGNLAATLILIVYYCWHIVDLLNKPTLGAKIFYIIIIIIVVFTFYYIYFKPLIIS